MDNKLGITAKEAMGRIEEWRKEHHSSTTRDGALWTVRRAAEKGCFSCKVPVGAYLEDLGFNVRSAEAGFVTASWNNPNIQEKPFSNIRKLAEAARRRAFRKTKKDIIEALDKGEFNVTVLVDINDPINWYTKEMEKNGFNVVMEKINNEGIANYYYNAHIDLAKPIVRVI